MQRQSLQAGFLLHHQSYRESSLLIDVFTQAAGRVSLIAKGVKQQKAQYLGALRPFVPLNISYIGSGSLKTLSHVETGRSESILPGLNTYCGFYLNELLRYFLPLGEPYPDIFINYLLCLQQLKSSHKIEPALRIFEIQLMQSLGYSLQLENDYLTQTPIQADNTYQYDIEQGATISLNGQVSGATLIAMRKKKFINQRQLQEAKQLMRLIIDYYLQGKTLNSRTLISKLIKPDICKSN